MVMFDRRLDITDLSDTIKLELEGIPEEIL